MLEGVGGWEVGVKCRDGQIEMAMRCSGVVWEEVGAVWRERTLQRISSGGGEVVDPGWAEQRERRGMSTGVGERYPPGKKAWTTNNRQTARMLTLKCQHPKDDRVQ